MAKKNLIVVTVVLTLILFCGCTGPQNKPDATSISTGEEKTLPEVTSTTWIESPLVTTITTPPKPSEAKTPPSGWDAEKEVSGEGFITEYSGYAFRINHFIYSSQYAISGVLLDVRKPDGTIVEVQASSAADGLVDDLEIGFPPKYAKEDGKTQTAVIYIRQAPVTTTSTGAASRTTTIPAVVTMPPAAGEMKLLNDVSDEGFIAQYENYAFRIDDFLYSDGKISGIILDVKRPDGTVKIIQMVGTEYGYVDDMQIKFAPESAMEGQGKKTASIYVVRMLE